RAALSACVQPATEPAGARVLVQRTSRPGRRSPPEEAAGLTLGPPRQPRVYDESLNMPVSDSLPDLGQDFANRFGELLKVAGANAKPKEPALVSATVERGLLVCDGFLGGKDVEIVVVRAKRGSDGKPVAVKETL